MATKNSSTSQPSQPVTRDVSHFWSSCSSTPGRRGRRCPNAPQYPGIAPSTHRRLKSGSPNWGDLHGPKWNWHKSIVIVIYHRKCCVCVCLYIHIIYIYVWNKICVLYTCNTITPNVHQIWHVRWPMGPSSKKTEDRVNKNENMYQTSG